MDMLTVMFIAVGLAMDSLAVSITSGLTMKNPRINNALKIAMFFGLFQAGMPIIGWLAGLSDCVWNWGATHHGHSGCDGGSQSTYYPRRIRP